MSDPNGWPDPQRPGVPMNPERDGWHIVNGGPRIWDAYNQHWKWNDGIEVFRAPPEQAARQGWGYKGPLLVITPAEVAARVAEARRDALREVAWIAQTAIEPSYDAYYHCAAEIIAAAILARAEAKP